MRVAIIHPWFPQYRRKFFKLLRDEGLKRNITIDIYYGAPPPELTARADAVEDTFAQELDTKYFTFGSKSIGYKSLKKVRSAGPYNLIIVEQAVRNLETYALLFTRLGKSLAFWGHGHTYTKRVGRIQEKFKTRLTMFGVWFFAYTNSGAKSIARRGFPQDAITVVNNSIDTRDLRDAIAAVEHGEVTAFRKTIGAHGPTALFVGGLDESKRIDFILEAAEKVAKKIPDFKLIVAGRGVDEKQVIEAAEGNNYIVYVGNINGRDKAVAMKAADVLMMPGRVGLVAVDSFAAGVPIVTTDWPWHAPEFEYLIDGVNALVSSNNVSAYAGVVSSLLKDPPRLAGLSRGCIKASEKYTVEAMVNNFLEGLLNLSETEKKCNG